MYDTTQIDRDDFVRKVSIYQVAHGWSRLQLTILFDHLEEQESDIGEEREFDYVERSNFADYDNPEWDDVRNCGNTVVDIFGSSEAIVSG